MADNNNNNSNSNNNGSDSGRRSCNHRSNGGRRGERHAPYPARGYGRREDDQGDVDTSSRRAPQAGESSRSRSGETSGSRSLRLPGRFQRRLAIPMESLGMFHKPLHATNNLQRKVLVDKDGNEVAVDFAQAMNPVEPSIRPASFVAEGATKSAEERIKQLEAEVEEWRAKNNGLENDLALANIARASAETRSKRFEPEVAELRLQNAALEASVSRARLVALNEAQEAISALAKK